jgi:hypothetical protein
MFGESFYDKRDLTFGLAGMLAGLQSLRILAERGIASSEDIRVSLEGIRILIAGLPAGSADPDMLRRFDRLLSQIAAASTGNRGFDGHAASPPPPTWTPPAPDPRYNGANLRRDALDDQGHLMSIEEYERKRDG